MKQRQKYRLSIFLSLMSVFLFVFGLKQGHCPHLYREAQEHIKAV